MKLLSKSNLLLFAIFLLSLVLRLYHLSILPPGLTWDEAALGYNSYSILKTAHDEHGAFLPVIFKSFGDYKPGLYVYLALPGIALASLNEFTTRLPSAVFGALAAIGIYLFTNLVFAKLNKGFVKVGHFAALLLSLSPWHLHFSHSAWEANVALTLTIFALFFWLKFLLIPKTPLWPSLLLSLLTLYTYQSAKLITPAAFIIVIFAALPQFLPRIKQVFSFQLDLIFSSILILFCALVYLQALTGPAGNRLSRLSIFNYQPQVSKQQVDLSWGSPTVARLLYSNLDLSLRSISSRYLYHLSPEVLFYQTTPTISREHIPRLSLLHILEVVPVVLGAIALSRLRNRTANITILGFLLLGPLPAALTLSEYSPVRSLFTVFPLLIIAGLGFYYLHQNIPKIIYLLILASLSFNIILDLSIYYNHAGPRLAADYNYGYKQAIEEIKTHPADTVVMTDVLGQPYIYYLFYTTFDPKQYQQINDYIDQGIDVGKVGRVGKVEFHQFAPSELAYFKNTLFIGQTGNIPDNFDLTAPYIDYYTTITDPFGQVIFKVIKTKS